MRIEYKGTHIYQTPEEQALIRGLLGRVKELTGDVVEVGVFDGGTARIIREELPEDQIFLCDTFAGFPELHESDIPHFKLGECATTEESVTKLFKDDTKVKIIKGKFPDTAKEITSRSFKFVHLDTDIYPPTKAGLEYFFPKMVEGGIILVHDYPVHPGVKLAVDNWLLENPGVKSEVIGVSERQFAVYK